MAPASSAMLVCFFASAVTTRKCHFNSEQLALNCRARGLAYVPSREFPSNTLEIDLSYNNIAIVRNKTFQNVTNLQSLDVSHNCIETIESMAFYGLRNLVTLNLSKNEFVLSPDVLSSELFTPVSNLRMLRIERLKKGPYSSWKGIDGSLAKLKNLATLFIDFPKDFAFESGFGLLTKLSTISTSGYLRRKEECELGTIRNSTFEGLRNSSVKELSLVYCAIGNIELSAFEPLKSLEFLDLSWNTYLGLKAGLKSLYGLQGRNMDEIRLRYVNNASCVSTNNFILNYKDFSFLMNICVKSVDMSSNFISYIDTDHKTLLRLGCIERLNISFHSFHCVPFELLIPLIKSDNLTHLDISYSFGTPSFGSNLSPYNDLRQMKSNIFIPQIPLPPQITSLNISGVAFWFYMDKLSFSRGSYLKFLDISYNNIDNCENFRLSGIENVTHLGFSNTLCRHLPQEFFLSLRKITNLLLSNSPNLNMTLSSLPVSPFAFLDVLAEIDLSACSLTDLHPKLFENNKQLRSVKLANNRFYRLPMAISVLAHLESLDLSLNAFTHLRAHEMRLLDSWMITEKATASFRLRLGGNPFQCTCSTILFIRWVLHRKKYLDKQGNYTCFLSGGSRASVFQFGQGLPDFEVKCVSQKYITLAGVGSMVLVLLMLLSVVIFRYRLNVRYWLYTKLNPPEAMFLNTTHEYDAFVAYTDSDYEWVFRRLRPTLESGDDPVRLCIHSRDFIPGKMIHENIVDNMKKSRKILLIISVDFLQSHYGPLEIEYAGMKSVEEGRDDIIVCVRMSQIPVRQMPRTLRNLWNKITFLDWNQGAEAVFWRNLKSALVCPRPDSM